MQKKTLITTPLHSASERRPVQIAAVELPTRFRSLRILWFMAASFLLWCKARIYRALGRHETTQQGAMRIRLFLEEMGGLWIKAGQFMAMRRDFFAAETCDELSRLQDRASGFSFDVTRTVVEDAFSAPLDTHFVEFDPEPLAAASIGQTHTARLRSSGVRVVVKVRRPHIVENFARDMKTLWFIAKLFRLLGMAPYMRWEEMLWELEKNISEELDYRVEATFITRMRKLLRKHHVYAPKVYEQFSAEGVLVMEFLEGVFMSDYIRMRGEDPERLGRWLAANNIVPKKLGERLLLSHFRQLFEDNLYHCDLHPGNILLQRDSRFALIDFGSVGSFDQDLLRRYHALFRALAEGNFKKTAEVFLQLGPPLPSRDITGLRAAIIRALRLFDLRSSIESLPYHEKSMTVLFNLFSTFLREYGVPAAWDFLRINRAELTLDASLMFLVPDLNYVKIIRRYEEQAADRLVERERSVRSLRKRRGELLSALQLPGQLAENLYYDGEWLRQRAQAFEGQVNKWAFAASGVLSMLTYASFAAALIFIGRYVQHRREGETNVSSLLAMWGALERFAGAGPLVWVAVMIAAIGVLRQVWRVRSYLLQKD